LLQINVLTSYEESHLIVVKPTTVGGDEDGVVQRKTEVKNVAWLSFWAEVHYNSIYMVDEVPHPSQRLPPSEETGYANSKSSSKSSKKGILW
jgi:hypothetical protein